MSIQSEAPPPAPLAEHGGMTLIAGYHEVQQALRSSVLWPWMFTRVTAPLLGGTLTTLEVDDHLRRRRTEVVMFSRAQLMDYELATVIPALREQLEAAFVAPGENPKVDIMYVMRDALLRVTAKIIGIDGIGSAADVDELRELAEYFGDGSSAEFAVANREQVVAAAVAAKDRFRTRFFDAALERRQALVAALGRGEITVDDVPNDLITLLLRNYQDWETEQLLREIIFYVTASANTTTHLAPHVLRELLGHLERHPQEWAQTADLAYLQRAVSEGLRLHPTVPALLRMALADVELPSGRRIAKGEQLLLDLNAANRDVSVFGPTAAAYDPHRPLPPRTTAYGLAFGDGAHTCLGRQVAVGAGNGSVDRDDIPAGVLTRLLKEVLGFRPSLDPDDPPVYRPNTTTQRFAKFPVVLRARAAGAETDAGRCPVSHHTPGGQP